MKLARVPLVTRALGVVAVLCGLLAPAATAGTDPAIVYASQPAASALHDGLGSSWRQLPAIPNRRWGGAQRLGKVRGKSLAAAPSAAAMAAALRRGWRSERSAYVGVDEILPAHWSAQSARRLETAMLLLGGDAQRVIFYAGPSMVERLGRVDPRRGLTPRLQALVNAMARGRSTYLMTYRGNMEPFPEREMATHPTRWIARWPGSVDQLGLMIGPDGGLGQRAVWHRLRASAAGRRLLSNGVAAYGLRSQADAREWLTEYLDFLQSPSAAPQGFDARVPEPGGLRLSRMNRRVVAVTIDRPGRAVVRLVPRGERRGRVIRALWGPTDGKRGIALPRDVRPGAYTLVAVLEGDGLRDEARLRLRITRSGR